MSERTRRSKRDAHGYGVAIAPAVEHQHRIAVSDEYRGHPLGGSHDGSDVEVHRVRFERGVTRGDAQVRLLERDARARRHGAGEEYRAADDAAGADDGLA